MRDRRSRSLTGDQTAKHIITLKRAGNAQSERDSARSLADRDCILHSFELPPATEMLATTNGKHKFSPT